MFLFDNLLIMEDNNWWDPLTRGTGVKPEGRERYFTENQDPTLHLCLWVNLKNGSMRSGGETTQDTDSSEEKSFRINEADLWRSQWRTREQDHYTPRHMKHKNMPRSHDISNLYYCNALGYIWVWVCLLILCIKKTKNTGI